MATSAVVVPYVLPGELIAWLEAQAGREDIEPTALLHRAVERERRRLTPDAPPLDPRTKRVGVTGSRARVGAHELVGSDLADLVGVSPKTITRAIKQGAIACDRGGGTQGVPTVFTPAQARAALGVFALRLLLGDNSIDLQRQAFDVLVGADDVVFSSERYLVLGGGNARIVGPPGLPFAIGEAGGVVTVLPLGNLGA